MKGLHFLLLYVNGNSDFDKINICIKSARKYNMHSFWGL